MGIHFFGFPVVSGYNRCNIIYLEHITEAPGVFSSRRIPESQYNYAF